MDRPFGFMFEVNNEFRAKSPVAGEYIERAKQRIAARRSAVGPRGGIYRLVSPPDRWREEQDSWSFTRNSTLFVTRRLGRYVRPDRVTPELRLGDTVTFDTMTVAVVDGEVILPGGETVKADSRFVSFPVLAE